MTTSPGDGLLPLAEVAARLGAIERVYVGVRPVAVERIVGTLDRSERDFDRRFTPRRSELRRRLAALRRRYPDGDFPPVQLVELGGVYFVIDGHHRVALARALGMVSVDAEITSLSTTYAVPPGIDAATLVHTDQHRRFQQRSGLEAVRPDARIRFSRPQGYPELLEVMRAWGYERSVTEGRLLVPEEVAARWHDEVYRPALAALEGVALPATYAYKTAADLFLWVHQLRRSMLVDEDEGSYDAAARQARRRRIDRRFRRRFLRERSTPLEAAGAPKR